MNLSDRFKAALEALVLRITGKYDYAIPYACRVVQQNSDGTLELVPEDQRFGSNQPAPGLPKVPIRYGAPGITATVQPQARVIVEFENADPARPVVTAWDPVSGLISLVLNGGTAPVVGVGAVVTVSFPPSIPVSGTLSGAPFTGVLTIVNNGVGIVQGPGNPKVLV